MRGKHGIRPNILFTVFYPELSSLVQTGVAHTAWGLGELGESGELREVEDLCDLGRERRAS